MPPKTDGVLAGDEGFAGLPLGRQQEHEAISRLTKEALAAAKAGGVKPATLTAPLRSGERGTVGRRTGKPLRRMPTNLPAPGRR